MTIEELDIPGAHLIRPKVFADSRGEFYRTFCADDLAAHGLPFLVRQCNLSVNPTAGTLRGFHGQRSEEEKLITCVAGSVHDILLDLRPNSPTFRQWLSVELSGAVLLHVPVGCVNAWLTTSPGTILHYWHSDIYRPELEIGVRYNDPGFGFRWPSEPVVISEKDRTRPDYI